MTWQKPGPPRVYTPEEIEAFVEERPDLLRWHRYDEAFPP
jgi:hypothetical protein